MKQSKFNAKFFHEKRVADGFTLQSFAEALREFSPKAGKAIVWAWEKLGIQPGGTYLHAISAVLKRPIEDFFIQK